MRGPYTRHEDHPPLAVRAIEVPAECYNRARLVLMRAERDPPVWLDLPGLRRLKLALMDETWVVADWAMGKMPILAWADFVPVADRALQDAVPCALKFYLGSAERILPSIYSVMRRQLDAYLLEDRGQTEVIPLRVRT